MFDVDYWQEIWDTIARNKMRSILTGFGVFLGIFMFVFLFGISDAFKGGMMKILDGMAPNSCFFYSDLTSEPYKGYRKGRSWDMNSSDLTLLRQKSRTVDLISPMLWGPRSDKNVVYGQKSGSFGSIGVYSANFQVQKVNIVKGRVINDIDVNSARKVCVIGTDVADALFEKGEDPIGKLIRLNGIYFQVIGVVSSTSDISIGSRAESTVYIPFTVMQKTFSRGDAIHFLAVTAKSGYSAAIVEEEVKEIIKTNHSISPADTKAMGSFNAEMIFDIFSKIFIGVDAIALIVGIGSLLSGIIGICNIMLVTVRERTREIGVRRAIGAKPFAIVKQILSECVLLTSISGILGLLFGAVVLILVRYAMENGMLEIKMFVPPLVSFQTAMQALFILVISGVLAGLLPAFRALGIKAIDAIREE